MSLRTEKRDMALSMWQPWAWLMATGQKDIESRGRALPSNYKLPMRVYIHAATAVIPNSFPELRAVCAEKGIRLPSTLLELARGRLIGEMIIVEAYSEKDKGPDSPWWLGPYGFKVEDAVLYKWPVRYKGAQGWFEVKTPRSEIERSAKTGHVHRVRPTIGR